MTKKCKKNLLMKSNSSGFTIVELLIVVIIISILSGLVLSIVNVTGFRSKARDSQRVAELKKIQSALELFYTDNRVYPSTSSNWTKITGTDSTSTTLEAGYLNSVPIDPVNDSTRSGPCTDYSEYRYNYISDSQRYILTAIMEVSTSNDISECHGLVNWNNPSPLNPWCGNSDTYDTNDYCYGVENP